MEDNFTTDYMKRFQSKFWPSVFSSNSLALRFIHKHAGRFSSLIYLHPYQNDKRNVRSRLYPSFWYSIDSLLGRGSNVRYINTLCDVCAGAKSNDLSKTLWASAVRSLHFKLNLISSGNFSKCAAGISWSGCFSRWVTHELKHTDGYPWTLILVELANDILYPWETDIPVVRGKKNFDL